MGAASRALAEEVFDVRIVNDTILRAMGLKDSDPERRRAVRMPPQTLALPLTPHGL
jgi:hypothetical protein